MSQSYELDYYKVRLPLPLAQIYERIEDAGFDKSSHDLTCQLVDAILRLTVAPLASAYLENSGGRETNIDALLFKLPRLSLGDWSTLLFLLSRYFKDRPDPSVYPLCHLWDQLDRKRANLDGLLGLHRRIGNGVDGVPGSDQSCSAFQVFHSFVTYRNKIIGHGANRTDDFYAELKSLIHGAANELLSEGVFDLLGPPGSRLVCLKEIKATGEEGVMSVSLKDLTGYKEKRFDRTLIVRQDEGLELLPDRVAVLWPEPLERLLFLHPMLIFRPSQRGAGEVLCLNGSKGAAPTYLSYTTGEEQPDRVASQALSKIRERVKPAETLDNPEASGDRGVRRQAGVITKSEESSPRTTLTLYGGFFVVLTLALIAICAFSLAEAYWYSKSMAWERMYDTIEWHPGRVYTGQGFWIEMFRTIIALVLGVCWITAYIHRRDTYELFFQDIFRWIGLSAESPFVVETSLVEPPRGLKRVLIWTCRIFCFLLIPLTLPRVYEHNRVLAPQKLADCEGYRKNWPTDKLTLKTKKEFQNWRSQENVEHDYITPYKWYTGYSFCNFVIILMILMPSLFYSTVMGILRLATAKNNLDAKARLSSVSIDEVEESFLTVRENVRSLFAKQCWFICFLTICLTYQIWFDRFNLSPDADRDVFSAILVIFVVLLLYLLLFSPFYQGALGVAARRMDRHRRLEFLADNRLVGLIGGDPEIVSTMYLIGLAFLAGYPFFWLVVLRLELL